jgi:hypothetical protein
MKLTLIIELCHVTLKEEKWLEVVPNLRIRPMLAEDVSRIKDTVKVMHLNELGSDKLHGHDGRTLHYDTCATSHEE